MIHFTWLVVFSNKSMHTISSLPAHLPGYHTLLFHQVISHSLQQHNSVWCYGRRTLILHFALQTKAILLLWLHDMMLKKTRNSRNSTYWRDNHGQSFRQTDKNIIQLKSCNGHEVAKAKQYRLHGHGWISCVVILNRAIWRTSYQRFTWFQLALISIDLRKSLQVFSLVQPTIHN